MIQDGKFILNDVNSNGHLQLLMKLKEWDSAKSFTQNLNSLVKYHDVTQYGLDKRLIYSSDGALYLIADITGFTGTFFKNEIVVIYKDMTREQVEIFEQEFISTERDPNFTYYCASVKDINHYMSFTDFGKLVSYLKSQC